MSINLNVYYLYHLGPVCDQRRGGRGQAVIRISVLNAVVDVAVRVWN